MLSIGRCIYASYDEYSQSDRAQRVKDARGEAAKEIEAYKSKQDGEFGAFEKEVRRMLIRIIVPKRYLSK